MNDTQISLVQNSFAKVAPIAPQAAEIFYARLFEIAPEVKPYFTGDMGDQGMKLMTTLGVVVNGLRDLDKIVPVARELAIKHVEYGVQAKDYDPVGAALLYTLKTGLGDDFDAETEAAWTTAYTTLAGVMKDAAYPAETGET
ncbi:globin family protein [Shimia aestuarii]|uniref:Nitric oxide dioxygenase n=1 Tax=Shimia aestuarii TaxID=254406 RepID=A0A1I4JAC3_9RHOB|nr:globin family protein [Shimia aestuarii]SFL63529.1 nitric oxide dioxygenase [Shimia aestuarii]